jgi:valyl-tRNA synthetase
VSDLEVEYSEEPGQLYYFNYPVAGGGFLPVATTRPETILGDTAVAVHPDDERYAASSARPGLVPMLNREIPIIADEYVDMAFGTGALKVTPGHDPNDFEIGAARGLDVINGHEPRRDDERRRRPLRRVGPLRMPRLLWADMEAAGLTLKSEPYTLNVPRSQRGGEIIEPLISKQWFVNTRTDGRHGPGRRPQRPHPSCPTASRRRGTTGWSIHSPLVHQPPVVVGPPHPRLDGADCGAKPWPRPTRRPAKAAAASS